MDVEAVVVVLLPVELVPVPAVPDPLDPDPVVELDPLALEIFCNTPRSISNPPLRTIPCKVVAVLLGEVPNASRTVTVIVQSEFTVYVPTS